MYFQIRTHSVVLEVRTSSDELSGGDDTSQPITPSPTAAAAAAKSLQTCPTLCDPMDCSTLGFPDLHCLPELAQTHDYCDSDAIQPSNPLSSPSLPAFNLFEASGSFLIGQLFSLGGQSIEASASASLLPMNIQD